MNEAMGTPRLPLLLREERRHLTTAGLIWAAIAGSLGSIAAVQQDWAGVVASLVGPVFLFVIIWGALRFRRLRVAHLIRARSPGVTLYPEFPELVDRGIVPTEWTPVGELSRKTEAFAFIWFGAVVLPWFWGPFLGLLLGDVAVGVIVAATLSLPALVFGGAFILVTRINGR